MSALSRIYTAIRSPDISQPFYRLVPFNWEGELLVIYFGMLASFLVAGFWWPYWRIADMDFWIVYNAFLLNVPLPQEYFDHPGYLSILLLSYWLRALHAFGLVNVASLSGIPPVSDAAGFAQAWTAATRAGRVLSLIYALGFVLAFSYLLRAFVRDWRIAALGGFMLAFSGGMAMEMRIMRTELLAVALFFSALLILLIAATRGQRWWRPAMFGAAGFLITLAMQNKIQILFLICAMSVLLLPFGAERARQRGFWNIPRLAWPAMTVTAGVALLGIFLAKDILIAGFSTAATPQLALPALRFGATLYWPAIAIWIGLGMVIYTLIWRIAVLEAMASMLAALAGCMFGLLALYIRYNLNDVVVVFHPLEQMFWWAAGSTPQLVEGQSFFSAPRLRFLVRRDRRCHCTPHVRSGVVVASDDFPRMVCYWRHDHCYPAARMAAGVSSRRPHADGLGRRHAEYGARSQARILSHYRSARHHRRRVADLEADRSAAASIDVPDRRFADCRAHSGEPG